jgi:hypothetical protein
MDLPPFKGNSLIKVENSSSSKLIINIESGTWSEQELKGRIMPMKKI